MLRTFEIEFGPFSDITKLELETHASQNARIYGRCACVIHTPFTRVSFVIRIARTAYNIWWTRVCVPMIEWSGRQALATLLSKYNRLTQICLCMLGLVCAVHNMYDPNMYGKCVYFVCVWCVSCLASLYKIHFAVCDLATTASHSNDDADDTDSNWERDLLPEHYFRIVSNHMADRSAVLL